MTRAQNSLRERQGAGAGREAGNRSTRNQQRIRDAGTTAQRAGQWAKDLTVVWRNPAGLGPYERNARTHTKKQVHQIAASIREFGFTNPVLIDAEGGIIAGHGRVEAAKLLGLEKVPTIRLDHLSEAQKRAYVIADNRLAQLAGWDEELLAVELKYLSTLDLDFDVEITGFETAEIDILIENFAGDDQSDEADEVPELEEDLPPISRVGDLWLLGEHRLLCADALKPESYERLMAGARAQMVFTDPPYNVAVDGHVCGLGKIKHREFAMASGEMSESEFRAFLSTVLANLADSCADGALLYTCMDWRHLYELLTAGRNTNLALLNVCVWAKDNGGMGSFYRSKHELVCVFKAGEAPHINNIELGKYGRYRTNVWNYAGVNTLRKGRLEELAMHPTVKPVALVADAVKDCTRRGHIVLDAFAGSGTTIIAAEKTGRVGYALELDPGYVDVAIRRWQRLTGKRAIHADTRVAFEEIAESRARADGADANRRSHDRKTGEATDVS